MWPWIKRWRDWAMRDLWPLYRIGPQPQALHYSYEKAGLTLHEQPVPWNAEAVLVEALLRLPESAGRRKADFHLRVPEVFEEAFRPYRFRVPRAADCLICQARPTPSSVEELDVALDQALARLEDA